MDVRQVYTHRRWWPPLLPAAAAAVLAAVLLAAEPPVAVAAAGALALSGAWLALLAGRADRGAATAATHWRIAIGLAAASSAVLALTAGQTMTSLVLLVAALLFALAVALLGALVALSFSASPPSWMLDADGRPVGLVQRVRLAQRHVSRRLEQRPGRPPLRIYGQIRRDTDRMVWRRGAPDASAFSYLHIQLHPQTLRAMDDWMPAERLAADMACGYAEEHGGLRHRTDRVGVIVSSEPVVPLGVARVSASFARPRPDLPAAQAWAHLMDGPGYGALAHAERYLAERAGYDTAEAPPDADGTVVLPGLGSADPDATATMATTALKARTLTLRSCDPEGRVLPQARRYALAGPGPWTIGRSRSSDIVLQAPHVSRLHAEVVDLGDRWVIVDRSTHGTLVNGTAIGRDASAPISGGEVIELGRGFADRVLLRVL